MGDVEQMFAPAVCVGGADNLPAICQSLRYLRAELDTCGVEFTAWRTELLYLGHKPAGRVAWFWSTSPEL